MRSLPLLLVLLILPLASAELIPQGPQTGQTTEPSAEGFTFSAQQDFRDVEISSCSLIVDNETVKTLAINDRLGGTARRFTAAIEDGEHIWRARCVTADGETIETPDTLFIAASAVESEVTVTSSGIIRGSLLHSFTMRNSPNQEPITVSRVNPGDIVGVTLEIPPSKITKELFYKSRNIQGGQNYLRLTDRLETYELYQGENTTINITPSQGLIAQFTELVGTKATIVFYPTVTVSPGPVVEEPEEPAPQEPEEQPPEVPIPEPEEPTPPEEPTQPERRGFFNWLWSMLANVFGA